MFFSRRPHAVLVVTVVAAVIGFVQFWARETALAAPWPPDADARRFAQQPLGVAPTVFLDGGLSDGSNPTNASAFELPLRAHGRHIVDAAGRRFRLAAVNWYGASDKHMVPGGLDKQHRADLARTIRRLGFNTVRLPYADEMVVRNPVVAEAHVAANPDLVGKKALDVFAAVVAALTDAGLAVVVNNHITRAQWCCGLDPCDAGWANDRLPAVVAWPWGVVRWWWRVRGKGGDDDNGDDDSDGLCPVPQTETAWVFHWLLVMDRFRNNPRVVGADLRNEVRGLWGTQSWGRWAAAAERCGTALLRLKPDLLMIVGGTSSNHDLRGVAQRPVRLPRASSVVYAVHVYGWSGWGSSALWFWGGGRYSTRSYGAFAASMRRHWAYLVEQDVAPVWVGEFGAPACPSAGDARYWRHLVHFLGSVDADWGYWALNARKPAPDRPEAYGLLAADWHTPVQDYRLRDLWAMLGSFASRTGTIG